MIRTWTLPLGQATYEKIVMNVEIVEFPETKVAVVEHLAPGDLNMKLRGS